MADNFQIIITSADGTQRRRFPSKYWQAPSWGIERYGSYGDFNLPTSLAFSADSLPSIVLGDRVEFWYAGKRRYRGYISARTPSENEPETLVLSGYGASLALGKQRCTKRYAFSGLLGVDVSQAFAGLARDFLVGTNLPSGVPAVASVQALPIGLTLTNLDAWDKLASDVLATIVTATGNQAVWGVDVDPSGANRLFLRPMTSPAAPADHVLPVPGRGLTAAEGEWQSADIVNDLLLYGGPPQFPQLLHNGDFELPVVSGEGLGNLVVNGSFETDHVGSNDIGGQDGSQNHSDSWTFNSGATTDSDILNTPARATAYSGHRFLVLEQGGTANQVVVANLIAGHNYTLSVRSAKQIDTQTATGHVQVSVNGSGGALTSFSLPLTPSGQTWDYFSQTFAAPAGATSVSLTLACDSLSSVFGQPGGLCVDDVELYDASIVYQDGWQAQAFGSGAVNAVNWTYQDEVQDGGYSVYLDVSAADQDGQDAHLQPPDTTKITVQEGQAFRVGGWVKSPASTPNAPFPAKLMLEMEWYKSDGSYDSKIQHVETLGASVGGINRVGAWTYIEVTGTAPNGITGLNVYLTFRSSGVLLADSFSVRDENAPAMGAGDGSTTSVNPYQPTGPLRYAIAADSPLLPAGSSYAGSILTWGRRSGAPVTETSVLTLADALVYLDAYYKGHANPLRRPQLTIENDPRLYLPGETILLTGRSGPLLAPAPLPIVRVRESFEAGILKCSPELGTELPDETGAVNLLVALQIATYGPGGAASSYSDSSNKASGGGGVSAPTTAPVQSVQGQIGAVVLTPEEVGAEPSLGDPEEDGYVLSSTAAGVRSWTAPATGAGFAAAPPLVPTGVSQVVSYNGTTLNIQAVPAFYSGTDPAPSVPYVFWQSSTDGKANSDSTKTWMGYDGTSSTTFPGPVLQSSLSAPAAEAAAPVVRFRVRTENASGAQSAWYTQTADTVYTAPPAGSGLSITEAVGSGADVTLTTTYATIPNLSVPVAAGQAVDVDGLVELTADAATGLDDLYVQLYDTASGAAIANSERHISYLPAGKRGLVTVEKFVSGIAGGRTLVLQAKNGTAARGSVSSAKSLLQALAVTGGTSNGTSSGTGGAIVKPPAGTALKTSTQSSLINGLMLCLPLNEGSGPTVKDLVSGTTATLGAGWSWTTQSGYAAIQGDGTQSVTQFTPVTQVTGDWTILAIGFSNDPNNSGNTDNILFGQGTSNWGSTIATNISNYLDAAGGSVQISQNAPSGMVTLANVKSGGTLTNYSLASGSPVSLATGTDSTSPTMRSQSPGVWLIGAGVNTSRQLNGYLTALFFWNRALTAAELSSLAADPYSMFAGY